MSPRSKFPGRPRRRGAILLVVLVLLALFATIGLIFVLTADSTGERARANKEALDDGAPRPSDPALLAPGEFAAAAPTYVNAFLGQLLYDVDDADPIDAQSGVRGHSLARAMYGWNRTTSATTGSLAAYSGAGLVTQAEQDAAGPPVLPPPFGPTLTLDHVVNYSYMPSAANPPIIDPEWLGSRTSAHTGTGTGIENVTTFAAPRTYKNLAAPYTFADKKDLYLASLNFASLTDSAATGFVNRVVAEPSFHRYGAPGTTDLSVFNNGNTNPQFRLAPPTDPNGATNTDWTSPGGRYKIIRPRPTDHQYNSNDGRGPVIDFPYPPPNPDNTFTGDVQNLPGLPGVQRNDSLWLFPNGPVKTWSFNGKRYTALIAPLILDLSGRVNLNVAGNRAGASGDHGSAEGLGPWEINPRWLFDPANPTRPTVAAVNDPLLRLIGQGADFTRTGGAMTREAGRHGATGVTTPPADVFTDAGRPEVLAARGVPPVYSRFDATIPGSTGAPAAPVGTAPSVFPSFATTRYHDSVATLDDHPAQYRPDFFGPGVPGSTLPRSFPATDIRWLARPGDRAENYANASVARLLPELLLAGGRKGTVAPFDAQNRYDPTRPPSSPEALPIRPVSLDAQYNPTQASVVAGYGSSPTRDLSNLIRLLTTTFNTSTHRPTVELKDAAGTMVLARFEAIDMARPLPDYRADASGGAWQPGTDGMTLSPDITLGSAARADAARQAFARDIFVRLVAAENERRRAVLLAGQPSPALILDGTNVTGYDPTTQQFAHTAAGAAILKPFAQLAVNLVDAVDADDVATTLQYNTAGTADATNAEQFYVVGTELPRLVVNEAYAMVANNGAESMLPPDPNDKAMQPARTLFWLELHNPLTDDAALPQGGVARLGYSAAKGSPGSPTIESPVYQIVIARAATLATRDAIAEKLGDVSTLGLGGDSLVNGTLEAGVLAGFNGTNEATGTPLANDELLQVRPFGGAASPEEGSNRGFFVLGPEAATKLDFPTSTATDPKLTLRLPDQTAPAMGGPGKGMVIVEAAAPADEDAITSAATGLATRKYAVILRRLANPYLPPQTNPTLPNYNPYHTVDSTPPFSPRDRVKYTAAGERLTPPAPMDAAGSVGRLHPYSATGGVNQTGAGTPPQTFFKANSNYATPARWLQHLDRAPLNPLELVSVSAVAPQALTQSFQTWTPAWDGATQPTATVPTVATSQGHSAERLFLPEMGGGVRTFGGLTVSATPPTAATEVPESFLLGALDLLGSRVPQSGVALGAPVQGRINVNAINHHALTRALADVNTAAPSNFFRAQDVAGTPAAPLPDALHEQLQAAFAANNPIRGLNAPGGVAQTLFRLNPASTPPNRPVGFPDYTASGQGAEAQEHAAFRTELARKIWQSHSTTSDSFLVLMTVGFFEVRNVDADGNVLKTDGSGTIEPLVANRRLILGKELFSSMPGDCRVKYTAVVDRSQLALPGVAAQAQADPNAGAVVPIDTTATPTPQPIAVNQPVNRAWTTVTNTPVFDGAFPDAMMMIPPQQVDLDARYMTNKADPNLADPTQHAFQVVVDGTPVTLGAGSLIRLGFGDAGALGEGRVYRVTAVAAVTPPMAPDVPLMMSRSFPGPVRVTIEPLTVGTRYGYHPAGSVVTGVLFGNPGPLAGKVFDPSLPAYKAVVPLLELVK